MDLGKLPDKEALKKLASSREAGELMRLLEGQGGVRKAAQAAAGGDTAGLTALLENLTRSEQGARVIRELEERVRQAGLGQD